MSLARPVRLRLFLLFFPAAAGALGLYFLLCLLELDALMSLAASLCLGAALSLVLAGRLGRGLEGAVQVIGDLAKGEYHRRLAGRPGDEFELLAQAVNAMAEETEARFRQILRHKARNEAVLMSMSDGVMICDKRGRISAVNPAMHRLFPLCASFAGRQPIEVVSSPELQTACELLLSGQQALPPGQSCLTLSLGQQTVVEVTPIRLTEPEPGVLAVFHDVSRTRKLERIGRDLAANLSHELRTPLTSIKGYAETLLDDPSLPQAAKGFLEVIKRNADAMTAMADEMLRLSRLENARVAPVLAPSPLARAIAEAWRECSHAAMDKRISLADEASGAGLILLADPVQLAQVLRNLLENAIRHGPEGSAVLVEAASRQDMAQVTISDMGPGIPPAQRERVFERFYRVEKHRTKNGGGAGLGLAIAKHIVESHGGTIFAQSPRDGFTGAAIGFIWPLSGGSAPAREGGGGSPADQGEQQ